MKELPFIGTLRVSSEDSGGALEMIEYRGPAAPPPHVHRERDEVFYILKGAFAFTLATDDFEVQQGEMVHVPRGTRHGFKPQPGAEALLIIAPAGLEGFFAELGEGLAAGRSSAEIRAALAGRYDSTPTDA
ncbi:MAG: cupin domain-containing protein [Candidatus Dormiibacterota bacterium]